jgi:PIN domain nuclease of toxin-antitoxin system
VVLDTHIWIWLVTGVKPVPPEVLSNIQQLTEMPSISVVSIWEAVMLGQRGKVGMSSDPESTVRLWLRSYAISVVPVNTEIAFLSRSLLFKHADPADRFIAATAYHLDQPLATVDANLQSLDWLHTMPTPNRLSEKLETT